jgi:hypothetical protein
LQQPIFCSQRDKSTQDIHNKNEKEGITLMQPSFMHNGVSRNTIQQDWVEKVASKPQMIPHQTEPKPSFLRISIKKGQEIKPNAFEIKTPKDSGLILLVEEPCHLLNEHEIIFYGSAFNERTLVNEDHIIQLLAKIFDTSLAKLWTRLIGRKSLMCLASSFLRIKVMKAVFNCTRL